MAIVGFGTRGAPLAPCSSCSAFLSLAPLPSFSRRRVLGSASAAHRRHLSPSAHRDHWKGIFFIPCCGTHCSSIVKLNSRRDSRRLAFVKDSTYTTQFPAYYCTLSSYPKPDSYPDLSKVPMLKLKQHCCEPLAGGIAREGDKIDPKGRACYDTVLHAKHRWLLASQEAKLERESQQNYQSALKEKPIINDILENRALRDGKVCMGACASYKVDVYDPPAVQKGIPLDVSKHVTSSRRTLDRNVSHTSPLSQKSCCGNETHVSESKVLGPKCVPDNGYVANGNPVRSFVQANLQQQHDINGQVNGDELAKIYNKVLVVENISTAKKVAGIDVKQETPVDHGEIICFSIYSGPQSDFGNGKSCIWVDVLDGEKNILMEFAPFFENPNIRKNAMGQMPFVGGKIRKDPSQSLPTSKSFKVPNTDNIIEEGKKNPSKYRNITLKKIGELRKVEMYTASGWPSVCGDALKALAGKVSANIFHIPDDYDFQSDDGAEGLLDGSTVMDEDVDQSTYGLAFDAFGGGKNGKEACHAIAALCEVCSIDSLISNFILPLQ
ncbi:hypothetical protein Taro_008063, partial [Colocasia esculenta]|nr:hypothetical protein [Colocasia esculenta]